MAPRIRTAVGGVVLVTALGLATTPVLAADDGLPRDGSGPTAPAVIGDVTLARPLGLVSTVLGSAVFVGTLPFTVWQGRKGMGNAADTLVADPARFTFTRPIGEFERP